MKFMKNLLYITLLLTILILSSFSEDDKSASEYKQLQKFELLALKRQNVGKIYIYDLTKKEGCNKTTIKYLGIIKTNKGKKYKVLSSFFVLSAASTCHGTSNIKLYDMENKFVGLYYVGMPNNLPTKITKNKFICWANSDECKSRKDFEVNFEKGLPKNFFLPCSKDGGDECKFNAE